MLFTGGGGNNTVDGHDEPLGGGGYGGPSGGQGGSATGLGNMFNGLPGAPLVVASPGVLGSSSGKRAQVSQAPAYGTLTLNENGSFTYTPDADFAGVDVFLFTAVDIETSQASAPVPILLQIAGEDGSNSGEAPVAFEDVISAPAEGTAYTGALEAFENADTVQVVNGTQPQHGTLTLNSNGTYTYTPNTGFVGTDSFQYVAVNSTMNEHSEPATVTIVVYSTHPVGRGDGYWMHTGTASLVVNADDGVLSNDAWGDAAYVAANPEHGSVTMNTNGSFTYTPATGFTGTDVFYYRSTNSTTNEYVNVYVSFSVIDVQANPEVYATPGRLHLNLRSA